MFILLLRKVNDVASRNSHGSFFYFLLLKDETKETFLNDSAFIYALVTFYFIFAKVLKIPAFA